MNSITPAGFLPLSSSRPKNNPNVSFFKKNCNACKQRREIYRYCAVADTIKDMSTEAIQRLKDMNIDVIMITGVNKRTAESIAKQVGNNHVIVELLPEEKRKK